jgi:hypothetical protein
MPTTGKMDYYIAAPEVGYGIHHEKIYQLNELGQLILMPKVMLSTRNH